MMLTPENETRLQLAVAGNLQAYNDYQADKFAASSNSNDPAHIDRITTANQDFLAYILAQPSLAHCPTDLLREVSYQIKNITATSAQKVKWVALLRSALTQQDNSSVPRNTLGLWEALVHYHHFMDLILNQDELDQIQRLKSDDQGIVPFIKALICIEKKTVVADNAAVAHFQEAIRAKHVLAMVGLASLHLHQRAHAGRDRQTHILQAVELLQNAINQKQLVGAMTTLAGVHSKGLVDDNRTQADCDNDAYQLLQRAILAGDVGAMVTLAGMYLDGSLTNVGNQDQQDVQAVILLQHAVHAGNPTAMYNLALLHLRGRVKDNHDQQHHNATAAALLTQAMDSDDVQVEVMSAYILGGMYHNGYVGNDNDPIVNDILAAKFFTRAVEKGNHKAAAEALVGMHESNRIHDNLTPEQHTATMAMVLIRGRSSGTRSHSAVHQDSGATNSNVGGGGPQQRR